MHRRLWGRRPITGTTTVGSTRIRKGIDSKPVDPGLQVVLGRSGSASSIVQPAADQAASATSACDAATRTQSVPCVEYARIETSTRRRGSSTSTRTPTASAGSGPGIDHARSGPSTPGCSSASIQGPTQVRSSEVMKEARNPCQPGRADGTSAEPPPTPCSPGQRRRRDGILGSRGVMVEARSMRIG